ncbi:MAG: hypothetical protein LBH37_04955, partial [Oscillospiraceae bacterium]|nr:hypothetical protein [Oscillospiraceae bacterium]
MNRDVKNKNMKAFQITLCSVFCAITAFAKIASYMVPLVRTTVGLVIISGLTIGSSNACIVALVSTLVSGCFLGHGPPFQIVALSAIGYVSGLLSKNKKITQNKTMLCLWSILCVA